MLNTDLKKQIQQAYSNLLQSRQWKARYSQRLMIAEISKSIAAVRSDADGQRISADNCCVIEAGTGTGKTLAYTLATIPLAKFLQKKVIISTATVALQEQILYKDLPDIQKHSGLDFSFALAKGRQRYVCLLKLDRELQQQPLNAALDLYPDEQQARQEQSQLHLLAEQMLDAMGAGQWNGDRECWDAAIEDESWQALTADRNQCTGRHCPFVSQCSFFKARDGLEQVDCIVANHDLVLADLALGGGAILSAPQDTIYIFDEGHHLGQKAVQHFSHHLRLSSSKTWLEQLQQLPQQLEAIAELKDELRGIKKLPLMVSEIAITLQQFSQQLEPFVIQAEHDNYKDERRYRFEHGVVPIELSEFSTTLVKQYSQLQTLLQQAQQSLEENNTTIDKQLWEDTWSVLAQHNARVEQHIGLSTAYASSQSTIRWARWLSILNYNDETDFIVHASPILAQDILQNYLWSQSFAVIISSATLSSLGHFKRLEEQLGLPEATTFHRLQSPFDFNRVTLNIPAMHCEPQDVDAHTDYIIEHLPAMLERWPASLLLFSSRRQMRAVFDALDDSLQQSIITQDDGAKIDVIRRHRERIDNDQSSTIFGLASFAEGIDLPGRYCQHVIIAKIPFSVPGNPVEQALAEWLEQQGKNPFMEISVPDASQSLIQACGRLLRNETDEGEITLLDKRILSRRYGKSILESLPAYKRNFSAG